MAVLQKANNQNDLNKCMHFILIMSLCHVNRADHDHVLKMRTVNLWLYKKQIYESHACLTFRFSICPAFGNAIN